MPCHIWGSEFDFESLNKAMEYIEGLSLYEGLRPLMKEKYGTIRYEMIHTWCDEITLKQLSAFYRIVDATTRKFPTVAAEIIEDMLFSFDPLTENDEVLFKRWEKILDDHDKQRESC